MTCSDHAKIFNRRIVSISLAGVLALAVRGDAGEASNAPVSISNAPAPSVELKPTIAPPSGWVRPQFFDRNSLQTDPAPGVGIRWLLIERQANAAENETFFHFIRQVRTRAAVETGANLTFDFDPGYQSLTLHWARIWRGARPLERLDANNIKMARKGGLEQLVLDNRQSTILVLNDVRVGDVIQYAYSIKGANPIFNGHFSMAVPVQFDEPVEHLFTRLLWPKERPLFAKAHGCSIQPVVAQKSNLVEYTWDLARLPGFRREDSLPSWCDPEPWVQLTGFETWAEVNQWALALFQNRSPLSNELREKISEWGKIGNREEQILAALRFVQDNVRYLSIDIGASCVKPATPSEVFARRYGDCKDKSLLFVTMLRSLGIEAWPVLVNAELQGTVADWRPSAAAFNHCIAVVHCNGQRFWLDPTMSYQRGPLSARYLPSYASGLVVFSGTTNLTAIPLASDTSRTAATEYFWLGGKDQASSLKVVTVAEGRDADTLRALLAETKREDIEKGYSHFYAQQYPSIQTTSPLLVSDDEQRNRIETTESYTMPRMWIQSEKDGKYRCDFYPNAIAARFKKPIYAQRNLPLAVGFPQHQILRTEVTLPGAWLARADEKNLSDAAFTYRMLGQCVGNKLVMEYEYQSWTDAVPPDRVSQYMDRVEEASRSLGYTVLLP